MATSNFRIKKICEWCGKEFEAQKVSTRFCSHRCANFAYKRAIRTKRVQTTESQTQVQKAERIIEDIKEKEYLSFSETGRLLGLSRQAIYTINRERKIKGNRRKLGNPARIYDKKNRIHYYKLTYRWETVKTFAEELRKEAING